MNDGRAGLAEWLCCSSLALRPTLSGSLPFALFLDTFSLLFIHCFYEEASVPLLGADTSVSFSPGCCTK